VAQEEDATPTIILAGRLDRHHHAPRTEYVGYCVGLLSLYVVRTMHVAPGFGRRSRAVVQPRATGESTRSGVLDQLSRPRSGHRCSGVASMPTRSSGDCACRVLRVRYLDYLSSKKSTHIS
jgi:hypothetical protein